MLWALYIAYNRGILSLERLPGLKRVLRRLDTYDVIIGLIADDKLFPVYNRFAIGAITSKALIESLRYVKLGNQYVFKNQKACSRIKILRKKILSPIELRKSELELKNRLQGIEGVVRSMESRYKRSGKFIEDILEEYR